MSVSHISSRVEVEVRDLVQEGVRLNKLISSSPRNIGAADVASVSAWITRLGRIVRDLYGTNSQHFETFKRALGEPDFYILHSNYYRHFSQLVGVANTIERDMSFGLIGNVRQVLQAELFTDFLEMGEYLLREGYKDAAAVIIGTVLEDSVRKLCVGNSIPTSNVEGRPYALDRLNAELAKADVYSKLVQKQITTWAHIRNKAAHGEYDEYNAEEVSMMLLFVQGFVADRMT